MEKNAMAMADEALALLKANNRSEIAYAKFAGYAIALLDAKSAEILLNAVKNSVSKEAN